MPEKKITADCSSCTLAKRCLPSGIPVKDLYRFTNIVSTNKTFATGDVLFKQGAKATSLYVVKIGAFKTQIINQFGDAHVSGFYLPGDIIGLESTAGGITLNSSVAIEDSLACKISYRPLALLRKEFHSLSDLAVKIYSQTLATTQDTQNCLSIHSAPSRLAQFLILFDRRTNQLSYKQTDLHLNMSRQDMASHLGIAVETVSRSFTKLIDSGCITKTGRLIQIIDRAGLEKIAQSSSY
ncbi:MAG: helix-turn-helix domain-containing protein [Cycloclasticus sp.]